MERRKTICFIITAIAGCSIAAILTSPFLKSRITAQKDKDSIASHRLNAGQGSPTEKRGDHGDLIKISEQIIKEEGIKVSVAAPAKLKVKTNLPGEIVIDPDRMAHVVPRMGGIVIDVRKKVGDQVSKGEALAVMASRDLAAAKAAYLASLKRLDLATSNFLRFDALWKKEAVPEKQYLEIKIAREEAEIEKDSAEQKLRALGFSDNLLHRLPNEPADSLARYEITAPFNGTVVQKHITLGEMLKDDAAAFVIADLSSVWVNVYVYPKDLSRIRIGQAVIISTGNSIPNVQGVVEYVEPTVGDTTRSAIARVVLDNPDGELRPGLFVTAEVLVKDVDVPVAIPKTALKNIQNRIVTFVRKEGGFETNVVKTGIEDNSHIEIVSGLKAGQQFVSDGSFLLKAEAGKHDASD